MMHILPLRVPKFYKRDGTYYIFAPGGGVKNGWQVVLRSKNIYGPYEDKIVMAQGRSVINGPHQGAWVELKNGESWFLHFQDKGPYGRVVHLQPMKWENGWPVIGADEDGDGTGEPVLQYKKPGVGKTWPVTTPAESDEFSGSSLGMQWQWNANPGAFWAVPFPAESFLRLYSVPLPGVHSAIFTLMCPIHCCRNFRPLPLLQQPGSLSDPALKAKWPVSS